MYLEYWVRQSIETLSNQLGKFPIDWWGLLRGLLVLFSALLAVTILYGIIQLGFGSQA